MDRIRPTTLVVMLFMLPALAIFVVVFDVAGWGAAPEGHILATRTAGRIHFVPKGEPQPGASIDWYIMLDLPSDRTKWLNPGVEIRVIDVPALAHHARVRSAFRDSQGRDRLGAPRPNHTELALGRHPRHIGRDLCILRRSSLLGRRN